MLSKGIKILEINQYLKFEKTPSMICADDESWIKKVVGCNYNPEKLLTIKIR